MGNKQGASVAMTILLEAAIIAAIVIIPLMAYDVIPTPADSMSAFVAAAPPPPPPPPPPLSGARAAPPPPPPAATPTATPAAGGGAEAGGSGQPERGPDR